MQEIEDGVQKLFKLFGLFSVALVIVPLTLQGQSFSEFKHTQSGSFESFKEAKDKAFNSYLKEQWKEYTGFISPELYKKSKPKNIEKGYEKKIKSIGPRINIPKVKVVENNQSETAPKSIEVVKNDFIFDFFGTQLGFDIDHKIKDVRFYPKNQNGIIGFFNVLATSDYESIVYKIQTVSKEMALNDWGVYQLVAKLAKTIFTKPDEEKLFRWFILSKLSYDTKVALVQHHIVLLQNTQQIVYATPRYKIGDVYYYALDHHNTNERLGRLYTYGKKYPEANKKLNFQMETTPNFVNNMIDKKFSFSNRAEAFKFDIELNKNLIDFMGTYPQVDYDVYFNATLDKDVYTQVSQQVRSYINGKKASYGLNFLLHMVQKSFVYQRDDEQFGSNKVMFAEETLFYDRSDCEDRAVLFAKLVRKLFNYGVVGVKYPDHMSTALYIPIEGDKIKLGSRRYVIADPTYINANVGINMPKYKNIEPESFIKLD